ncbi:MAG: carbamoyltransferase [Desulfovibrio sp.]|jgi:carbamoyltransferase|nr:carbamoyltransferase [Desulfovibrio sp.]
MDDAQTPLYILGISAWYHDSAAVLLRDGHIAGAAQEERFSRKKHDPSFPAGAVRFLLDEEGLSLADLDSIVFYEKPFLKFERLLETYHAFAPRGPASFVASMSVWIKEKLFMRSMLEKELRALCGPGAETIPLPPFFFPEHHLSHAASAFFPSPFEEAAVVTLDGVGEWTTTSLAHGRGNTISTLRELHFPHSLGLLYSAFTAYCGFKVNSGEYKLMGLAPYGRRQGGQVRAYEEKIRRNLVDVREDGSFFLNMDFFAYAVGFRMYDEKRWQGLFGVPPRAPEAEAVEQEYMDMALAVQNVTEDIVLRIARTAGQLTGSRRLCLAGGVALNCVANGKLWESGLFDDIWVQPASGDAGGALGAALARLYIGLDRPRSADAANAGDGERPLQSTAGSDTMQGAYLGPAFSREAILRTCRRLKAPFVLYENEDELCDAAADLIAGGAVLGWFQGRMEYGPRALGNRSILADPRNPDMQKRLNLKVKYREGFRPFAPSVAEEAYSEFFNLKSISPYMLVVAPVRENLRNPLPDDYESMPLLDRLYVMRSTLPAVTHVDYSARVQTVNRAANPRYRKLLDAFHTRHGCPVLVNTSFNVRGEPLVCTPEDAYLCFMRTEMDYLVLGDCILDKKEQAPLREDTDWRSLYTPD